MMTPPLSMRHAEAFKRGCHWDQPAYSLGQQSEGAIQRKDEQYGGDCCRQNPNANEWIRVDGKGQKFGSN